ncbi:MAG: ATP-binding cassette domain-containing protein [Lachnospiraceae bacterium]|nr:ATP-binding cassette domain-containing protein [Ruminococcus sp.]MCM1276808.1 ATP-binding cassette domain-containing protein [Lachnospiraceae bacterium]
MENVISVKNVTKKYKEYIVVNNVSLNVEKGKIVGLIGRNGSGKTVLMKMICGLVVPSSGEVFVNGKHVGRDIDIPDNIGVIIETPGFLPNFSAYNNLMQLAKINRKIGKNEIREAIRKVGLDPDDKKHIGKFSLGMRQRLGLAQAIMEEPDLLILDEPMNGLDKDGVAEMRRHLLELKTSGKTILLTSHSAEDIDVLCDSVCEMDKGTLSMKR